MSRAGLCTRERDCVCASTCVCVCERERNRRVIGQLSRDSTILVTLLPIIRQVGPVTVLSKLSTS